MDHGGEAARPTTVVSDDLGMAGAVRGSEANIGSGTFDGELGAAPGSFSEFGLSGTHHSSAGFSRQVRAVAARGEAPVAAGFHIHRQPGPGVAYPNIVEFWRQRGPLHVVLVGAQLPDVVVPVHDNSGYSALQPHPGAGRGEVLAADLLRGGAVYNGEYALQLRPGAGHGEVLVDLLPDGAGHGEVFVDLLLGGGGTVHDDYADYPWQPRPGAGRGEVFIGPLPDADDTVFDSNFAQQTLPGTGCADGIAGALRDPNLGAGYDGSVALADDLGAAYNNLGMVAERLRRLLPFAGIGACSVAVNGLAAGPGSPAVAFELFAMFLGGLFLVILHVLRV